MTKPATYSFALTLVRFQSTSCPISSIMKSLDLSSFDRVDIPMTAPSSSSILHSPLVEVYVIMKCRTYLESKDFDYTDIIIISGLPLAIAAFIWSVDSAKDQTTACSPTPSLPLLPTRPSQNSWTLSPLVSLLSREPKLYQQSSLALYTPEVSTWQLLALSNMQPAHRAEEQEANSIRVN